MSRTKKGNPREHGCDAAGCGIYRCHGAACRLTPASIHPSYKKRDLMQPINEHGRDGCGIGNCTGDLCEGRDPDKIDFTPVRVYLNEDTGQLESTAIDESKTISAIKQSVKSAKEFGVWLKTIPNPSDAEFKRKHPKIHKLIKREKRGGHVALSRDEYRSILLDANFIIISGGISPIDEKDCAIELGSIRTNLIIKELKKAGFKYTIGKGRYGTPEISVFMLTYGAGRDIAVKAGSLFNQEAVVYSEKDEVKMEYIEGSLRVKGASRVPFELSDDDGSDHTELPTSDGGKYKFRFEL